VKLIGYVAVFDDLGKLLVDTHLPLGQLLPEGHINLTFGRLRQKYRQRKAFGVYKGEAVSQFLLRLAEEPSDCVGELRSELEDMPDNRCVYLGVGLNPQLVKFCLPEPLPSYWKEDHGSVIFKLDNLPRKTRRKVIKAYENLEGTMGLRSV